MTDSPATEIETTDIVVLGSGNAGLSAALAGAESGAQVVVLDRCPALWAGGNTAFTAGAYRTAFASLDALQQSVLAAKLSADLAAQIDMAPYTAVDFEADLYRVTDGRCDPKLARALVHDSFDATDWLARLGVPFELSFNRQAYKVRDRWRFWGGMVLAVSGGGKGLTAAQMAACERLGVSIRFEVEVLELLGDASNGVKGVKVRECGTIREIHARQGVILCAGGFEASGAMRAKHLGSDWKRAYVRGTPYNRGDILNMALTLGAKPAGDWMGCHATCWDANAPQDQGDQQLTNQFTKSGYPLGIMMNVRGERFVDEGLDLRNYTYAKFGRAILGQPGGTAFQVWDADGVAWLRKEEYADEVVDRISADSIEELATKLKEKGLQDRTAFEKTIWEYNEAVQLHRKEYPDIHFDPSVLDGLSTRSSKGGLQLEKTNWALPIVKPPFLSVKVACGVTFTFAGLAVDSETASVLSAKDGKLIPGLFCAGEMLGGLFYGNYPGGSGLTAGAVFGRKAGKTAASR